MTTRASGTFLWDARSYVEVAASSIAVGSRVVLTGKDGQGTYKGMADVLELLPNERGTSILVTLWTGQRRIYRTWNDLWMIRLATPVERPDPAPTRRPSANACSIEPHGEKDRLAAIGWYWSEGAWHSACVQHATVIPAWQSGDWRGQGSQPTLVR